MRPSKIKAKLKRNEPVLLTSLHFTDPQVYELTSLLNVDGIWLDMEHHPTSLETASGLVRAARVGSADIMIRTAKNEFLRMSRMLEVGAQGIMYPRCADAAEAREVVRWSKFAPLGERGIDGANGDNPYCLTPLTDYLKQANEETFVVVQVEDTKAVENAYNMACVDGVDVIFFGPGDFSILNGIPGQWDHPKIDWAMKTVADAARRAGKHWGMPVFSPEWAKRVLDLGGRFLAHGADILWVKAGVESLRDKFGPLGLTFGPKA